MATAPASTEEAFKQLWRWVTVNGATFPDQTPPLVTATVTVEAASSTAAVTSVNDSNVSATLLAANTSRKGALFFNDSTVGLYLKFGTTASATSFTVLIPAQGYYEVPGPSVYTGRIDGVWASDASGAARITELT